MKTESDSRFFRKTLLDWFDMNQRDLPWRRTYDPYQVWISEIMLQQTQMDRVVEYFSRWMELFPDAASIAGSPERAVLKAWEGLGYYSRARNIKKAAEKLVEEYNGRVPEDYDALLSLPGIGPYTAAAVMSIAFEQPYPVVDANVERLFARLEDVEQPVKQKEVHQQFAGYARGMLRDASPRDLNQALMELGALVCTPKNPDCSNCPVQQQCRALEAGTVAERPVKEAGKQVIDIVMACTILIRDKKIFIQQRQYEDVWGGLWEFPGGRMKTGESPAETAVRELLEETELQPGPLETYTTVTHFYTRYRVTLHSFLAEMKGNVQPRLHAALQYRWVSPDELEKYPFPAGHRRLVEKLKNTGGRPVVNI
jgi:A/G-specific adenine glycosylase